MDRKHEETDEILEKHSPIIKSIKSGGVESEKISPKDDDKDSNSSRGSKL
jgi:hypothetical protein